MGRITVHSVPKVSEWACVGAGRKGKRRLLAQAPMSAALAQELGDLCALEGRPAPAGHRATPVARRTRRATRFGGL